MATNYPGSLDTSTQQPSPSASTEMDDSGFEHDAVHTNHSGAIIALETKVGTGDSNAVASSVLAGTGSGTSGWTTTPTVVDLTVTGDIGIGETSPETPLHIVTANRLGATFTGTVDGEGLRVDQSNYTSGNYVSLVESSYLDSQTAPHVRIAAQFTGSGSLLHFGTSNNYSAGVNNQAMTIDRLGNVGIGDTTPSYKLDVNGTGRFTSHLTLDGDLTGTSNTNFFVKNDSGEEILFQESSNQLFFKTNGTYRGYFNTDGHFLPYADNTYDIGGSSLRWDDIYATNGTIQTSDERDKTDVTPLNRGLAFIDELKPVSFRWSHRGDSGPLTRTHWGFLAQDVAATLGDAASASAVWTHSEASEEIDAEGATVQILDRQGLRMGELIAPVVKAIQELSTRVAALEAA